MIQNMKTATMEIGSKLRERERHWDPEMKNDCLKMENWNQRVETGSPKQNWERQMLKLLLSVSFILIMLPKA